MGDRLLILFAGLIFSVSIVLVLKNTNDNSRDDAVQDIKQAIREIKSLLEKN